MEEAKELAGKQMVNYMRWVCHWRGLGSHMDPGEELPKTEHKLDLVIVMNSFINVICFLERQNYVIEKIEELKSELNLKKFTGLVKFSWSQT